jgi:carbon storage regulator CsrA
MLMLTRNKGESIDIIDSNTQELLCTITLLQIITKDRARLGFDAPKHISIVRDNAVRVLDRRRPEEKLGGGDVGCKAHEVTDCVICRGEGT